MASLVGRSARSIVNSPVYAGVGTSVLGASASASRGSLANPLGAGTVGLTSVRVADADAASGIRDRSSGTTGGKPTSSLASPAAVGDGPVWDRVSISFSGAVAIRGTQLVEEVAGVDGRTERGRTT